MASFLSPSGPGGLVDRYAVFDNDPPVLAPIRGPMWTVTAMSPNNLGRTVDMPSETTKGELYTMVLGNRDDPRWLYYLDEDGDRVLIKKETDVIDWLELSGKDPRNTTRARKRAKLFVLDDTAGTPLSSSTRWPRSSASRATRPSTLSPGRTLRPRSTCVRGAPTTTPSSVPRGRAARRRRWWRHDRRAVRHGDTTTAVAIKCYGGVDGQATWTADSRPLMRSERLQPGQRWKAVASRLASSSRRWQGPRNMAQTRVAADAAADRGRAAGARAWPRAGAGSGRAPGTCGACGRGRQRRRGRRAAGCIRHGPCAAGMGVAARRASIDLAPPYEYPLPPLSPLACA